jgi:hypothetical protein
MILLSKVLDTRHTNIENDIVNNDGIILESSLVNIGEDLLLLDLEKCTKT